MKRLLATILAICCILSIVGCSVQDKTYELPHQFCYTADKLKTVEVSTNAQQRIIDILNSASWNNGCSDYEADYIFYTQNQEIEYNSENGVFFDVACKKKCTLLEAQRTEVNIILGAEKLVSDLPVRTIWSGSYLGQGVTSENNVITAVIPELDNATVEYQSYSLKLFINGEFLCSDCTDFYIADITGDGKYEICLSLSHGFGIISNAIAIYDFETMQCIYELHDRMGYDYYLNKYDKHLSVEVRKWNDTFNTIKRGTLLYNGSEFFIRWDSYLPKENE